MNSSNYWTPLASILEEEEEEEEHREIAASTTENHGRNQNETMIIDSGATSHFATESIDIIHTGTPSTKQVFLPDGSTIRGSVKATLPFHTLPKRAKEVDVLPRLQQSLLSVGKLADEGYTTVFHPRDRGVTIHKEGTLTLTPTAPAEIQGWRANTGLWEVGVNNEKRKSSTLTEESAQNVHSLPSTLAAVRFLHAAAGFPTQATWIAAIKAGNFVTWPGLTAEAVNKHFPESDETLKGHMKMQRMNVRSTKKKAKPEMTNEDVPTAPNPKKNDVYISVFNAHDTVYTDQTGGFPVTSSRGNKYIMVMCEVDGNYIDAEPMKSRTSESMVNTYLSLWKRLTSSKVITPKLHILDNEAPEALKEAIKSNCKMQLVPPDTHRSNLAERAIQTFKSHFVSILSGVSDKFPLHLWDRLLPQTILTLNLLRQSNVNPNVSAYHYVNGPFDYNAMPLGPMGCEVQIYNGPDKRKSWEERSLDGWYLGTSPEHYRCHRIYVRKTKDERVSNTVTFKHRYITNPAVTEADIAIQAIRDLTKALKTKATEENNMGEFESLRRLEDLIANKLTGSDNRKKITFAPTLPTRKDAIVCEGDPFPRVPSHEGPAYNTRQ